MKCVLLKDASLQNITGAKRRSTSMLDASYSSGCLRPVCEYGVLSTIRAEVLHLVTSPYCPKTFGYTRDATHGFPSDNAKAAIYKQSLYNDNFEEPIVQTSIYQSLQPDTFA